METDVGECHYPARAPGNSINVSQPWKLDAARDVFTVSGVLPLVVGQWGHICCPRGGVEVTGAEG